MGIHISKFHSGKTDPPGILEIELKGKLTTADYESFVPEIERITGKGKIRMLVELVDFHGWSAGALWEDTKFAVRHFSDIERLAIVGDKSWEKGMALFCKPFTRAIIRYFDISELEKARDWIFEKTERPETVEVKTGVS
jgi:hypothetical protein